MTTKDPRRLPADVTRRGVMIGAAGLSFGVITGLVSVSTIGSSTPAATSATLNPWVTIAADGTITIMSPASEMGQGSKTSLPLILAEEMDADWDKVQIVPAPPNDAIYGNPGLLGEMFTAGSTAVRAYFSELRQFGAQVRLVLLDNAARRLGVPVSELKTEPGVVVHSKSKRKLGYGDIATFLVLPAAAPAIKPEDLKTPSEFRLIGKDVMRFELPTKVNGAARYSIDVEVPDMVYGVMIYPPTLGSEIQHFSDDKAKRMTDVVGIYRLPIGVGIVAKTPWAASAARNAVEITWKKPSKTANFASEKALEQYAKIARGEVEHKSSLWDKAGDGVDSLNSAATLIDGEFRCDYAYHAQMEPLNAVASVSSDGKFVDLWCGTQSQTMAVTAAADTLGIKPENVGFHEMLLGGGFGRRGPRDEDFILPALLLSKQVNLPVKVMWSREDDIHNGRFRPMSAHYLQAGFDSAGVLKTWHHRVATDNVGISQDPVRYYGPWKENDMISLPGTEIITYSIPNRLAEHFALDSGIRVSPLRGIGFTANKFATEAFMDELARRRGIDPLAFRLSILNESPRAYKVVETVAAMAQWGRKRDGRGLGLAYIDYSGTQVAGVAEISVDRKSGQIKVHQFWVAIDAGIAVQPDNIAAQVEGSVIFGMGVALTEQITVVEGEVQQSNFYDYTVMRMSDMPEIQVNVLSTDNKPTGVGQMGTPLVAPAISNAVAGLLGVRLNHTPMLPQRVLAALRGEPPRQ
jgi:isoquinoline 1-oxidoreductase beta subunit